MIATGSYKKNITTVKKEENQHKTEWRKAGLLEITAKVLIRVGTRNLSRHNVETRQVFPPRSDVTRGPTRGKKRRCLPSNAAVLNEEDKRKR